MADHSQFLRYAQPNDHRQQQCGSKANSSNYSQQMNGYRQQNTQLPPGITQNQPTVGQNGHYHIHHLDSSQQLMLPRGNSNNSINMNPNPHSDQLNSHFNQQQMLMHQRQYQSENEIYFDQSQSHCFNSSGNIQPLVGQNQQIQGFAINQNNRSYHHLQQQQQQHQHSQRFKQQQPLSSDETIHLQQSPPLIQNTRINRLSYQQSSYPHLYQHTQQFQLQSEAETPPLQVASTPHIRSQTHIHHPSQPAQETPPSYARGGAGSSMLIEHLELAEFKIEPCANVNNHNHKQCKYYHSQKDRRRTCVSSNADMCTNIKSCHEGDACTKAHNKVEELYCEEKYKTKFCTQYPNNCHNCEYGNFCSFAHAEDDITIDLIENYPYDEDFYIFYYKTIHCPFNFIRHDKANCVYSHNWQDYRRKPQDYHYDPQPCPNWKPNSYITKYEEGCPNKLDCKKCHGWKEMEYHPRNYRTKQCTQTTNHEKCNKGPQCPYYHMASEKRVLPPNVFEGLFKYRPRNRNIRNTFKQQQGQTPNDNQRQVEPALTSPKLNQIQSTQSLPDSIHTQHLINYPQNSQQILQSQHSQQHQLQQQQHQQKQTNGQQMMMHFDPPQQAAGIIQKPMRLSTSFQLGDVQKDLQSQSYDENSFLKSIKCGLDFEDTSVDEDVELDNNKRQSVFSVFGEAKQTEQQGSDSATFSQTPLVNNSICNGKADLEELREEVDEMEDSLNKFSLLAFDNSNSDFIFSNSTKSHNQQ